MNEENDTGRNLSIKRELDALIKTMRESSKRDAAGATIGDLLKSLENSNKKDAESEAMKADLIMKLTNQQRVIDDTNATRGAVNLAQRNVAALQELIEENAKNEQSEEDRREANKMSKKILDSSNKIGAGLKSIEKGIGSAMSGAAKGLGLAGLIMLFADPKTLIEYITKTFNFIHDFLSDFYDVILGKKSLFDAIKNNLTLSLLVGGSILLKIGASLASVVSSGMVMFATVSAWATSIMSLHGGFLGVLKHFAKVGLVVGAIVLTVVSLYRAVKASMAVFAETGSKWQAFQALVGEFFANILGIPANILKSLISSVASLFGADALVAELDGLDMVSVIRDSVNAMFGWIGGVFDDIMGSVRSTIHSSLGGFNDEEQEAYDKRKRGREIADLEEEMKSAPEVARQATRGARVETKGDIKKKLDGLYELQGVEPPVRDDSTLKAGIPKELMVKEPDTVVTEELIPIKPVQIKPVDETLLAPEDDFFSRLSVKRPEGGLKEEQDISNAISARKESNNMSVAAGGDSSSVVNNTVNNTNISNDASADTLTRGMYAPLAY